jgi:hypothetical protein
MTGRNLQRSTSVGNMSFAKELLERRDLTYVLPSRLLAF